MQPRHLLDSRIPAGVHAQLLTTALPIAEALIVQQLALMASQGLSVTEAASLTPISPAPASLLVPDLNREFRSADDIVGSLSSATSVHLSSVLLITGDPVHAAVLSFTTELDRLTALDALSASSPSLLSSTPLTADHATPLDASKQEILTAFQPAAARCVTRAVGTIVASSAACSAHHSDTLTAVAASLHSFKSAVRELADAMVQQYERTVLMREQRVAAPSNSVQLIVHHTSMPSSASTQVTRAQSFAPDDLLSAAAAASADNEHESSSADITSVFKARADSKPAAASALFSCVMAAARASQIDVIGLPVKCGQVVAHACFVECMDLALHLLFLTAGVTFPPTTSALVGGWKHLWADIVKATITGDVSAYIATQFLSNRAAFMLSDAKLEQLAARELSALQRATPALRHPGTPRVTERREEPVELSDSTMLRALAAAVRDSNADQDCSVFESSGTCVLFTKRLSRLLWPDARRLSTAEKAHLSDTISNFMFTLRGQHPDWMSSFNTSRSQCARLLFQLAQSVSPLPATQPLPSE